MSLAQIRQPALCITGSEDRMVPPIYTEHLQSGLKGSDLTIVQGAGHMLPLEKPSEYNEAVKVQAKTLALDPANTEYKDHMARYRKAAGA